MYVTVNDMFHAFIYVVRVYINFKWKQTERTLFFSQKVKPPFWTILFLLNDTYYVRLIEMNHLTLLRWASKERRSKKKAVEWSHMLVCTYENYRSSLSILLFGVRKAKVKVRIQWNVFSNNNTKIDSNSYTSVHTVKHIACKRADESFEVRLKFVQNRSFFCVNRIFWNQYWTFNPSVSSDRVSIDFYFKSNT